MGLCRNPSIFLLNNCDWVQVISFTASEGGGICITCNCENREDVQWAPKAGPDVHTDHTDMICNGCNAEWQDHNIGIGRTVIAADWEKNGWSIFVFAADPPYRDLSHQDLREEASRSNVRHDGRWREEKIRRALWEGCGVYLNPKDFDDVDSQIEWCEPSNNGEIHPNLYGGYYLRDLPENFFIEENFLANGPCDLIIENAHLRRRTETSLAQVHTDEELMALHRRSDDDLRIFEFPNTLTKRARLEAGIELPGAEQTQNQKKKSKLRDPEAILNFTLTRRSVLLRRFDPEPKIQVEDSIAGLKQAQSIGSVVNYLRDNDQGGFAEELDARVTEIRDNQHPYSLFLERLDEIRADYNQRLNLMRFYDYEIPEVAEGDVAKARNQIADALGILDAEFGGLQVEDERLPVLKEYVNIELENHKLTIAEIREMIPEEHQRRGFNNLNKSTLFDILIENGLEPEDYLGEYKVRTWRIKRTAKMNTVMSVYACVFDNEMRLRRNPSTDDFIGVDTIWSRLLQMSPYHGSHAGVARANLMWYGVRMGFEKKVGRFSPRIIEGASDSQEYFNRQNKRREWRRLMKTLIRIFRDAGLEREANGRN